MAGKSIEEFKKELDQAIAETNKHRPFVGVEEKDYYRGQWDVLAWVLEELYGEEV